MSAIVFNPIRTGLNYANAGARPSRSVFQCLSRSGPLIGTAGAVVPLSPHSRPAAWARCIVPETRGSIAP